MHIHVFYFKEVTLEKLSLIPNDKAAQRTKTCHPKVDSKKFVAGFEDNLKEGVPKPPLSNGSFVKIVCFLK